uniref:Uncharacterized protein n=1 Tax=Strongyloides stercoralis TaxID=6248 RepID=A0A0K0EER3_STRER
MIGKFFNLKNFIIFLTFGFFIDCHFIYNPYITRYAEYMRKPGIINTPVIPVTVPGHNGRSPFINNGAGFFIQSAALLNSNNVVIPPTRILSIPSFIAPVPTLKQCKYGQIC